MGTAGTFFSQRIHKFLGDSPDDLIAVLVQIAQQRQPDGQIASQIPVFLHQKNPGALTGGGDGSGQAAGASAYNDHVILQRFQFHDDYLHGDLRNEINPVCFVDILHNYVILRLKNCQCS